MKLFSFFFFFLLDLLLSLIQAPDPLLTRDQILPRPFLSTSPQSLPSQPASVPVKIKFLWGAGLLLSPQEKGDKHSLTASYNRQLASGVFGKSLLVCEGLIRTICYILHHGGEWAGRDLARKSAVKRSHTNKRSVKVVCCRRSWVVLDLQHARIRVSNHVCGSGFCV